MLQNSCTFALRFNALMIKKIVIYLSVTIGIIALIFGGIWSYYSIRWPYQWQHAEQTSLSTHFWDPLLILMKSEPSEIKEQMTAIDTEAYHRNWDKVQKLTENDQNSSYMAYYHNLSLAYQNKLSDSLMHHYAPFERALFINIDEETGYARTMAAGEVWWALGDYTMAEHATILGMIFSPRHTGTRALRRLAEINVAVGDSAAAMKYLRILKKTPRHRRWAEAMKGKLNNLKLQEGRDTVRIVTHYDAHLRNLLDNNPYNIMAHEYLLCLDLLLKNLNTFRADIEKYGYLHPSRLYQEAILILMMNDDELRRSWSEYVDEDVYREFLDFTNLMETNNRAVLTQKYKNTYWFYFQYAKRNDK